MFKHRPPLDHQTSSVCEHAQPCHHLAEEGLRRGGLLLAAPRLRRQDIPTVDGHHMIRPLGPCGLPEVLDSLLVCEVARAVGAHHPVLLGLTDEAAVVRGAAGFDGCRHVWGIRASLVRAPLVREPLPVDAAPPRARAEKVVERTHHRAERLAQVQRLELLVGRARRRDHGVRAEHLERLGPLSGAHFGFAKLPEEGDHAPCECHVGGGLVPLGDINAVNVLLHPVQGFLDALQLPVEGRKMRNL
mmetsp:Transcript_13401/g.32575  ORF Transcript_13401/g.32575 Transcript_13401/m.32575 type:complete len:245 (-) Transcript_13401:823-1557(-)